MKAQKKKASASLPALSKAEWEVMKPLWRHDKLAAREVFAELEPGHGWASKTVKTLLSRLVAKGALQYEQVGNAYLYRAAHSQDEMTRHEVKGFAERVLDGSSAPLVAHFIEQADLSAEEIERLRKVLDQKQRGRKRGAGGEAS